MITDKYTIIMLGDSEVGKSSMLRMYNDRSFTFNYMTTVGVDVFSMTYKSPENKMIPVRIWDTSGQERFHTITYSFYKNTDAVAVCFDITSQKSFKNVKVWLRSIYEHSDQNIVKILVGNKIDLDHRREVSYDEAMSFAQQNNIQYIETSAKDNINIGRVFESLSE